ncbi:MAG: hypothetical protein K8T10_21530 [Candidatus Eremiobacteraeota bacterium]|nr:hypothetical protein [Candidatus Eremiobacteraeota bacterium]
MRKQHIDIIHKSMALLICTFFLLLLSCQSRHSPEHTPTQHTKPPIKDGGDDFMKDHTDLDDHSADLEDMYIRIYGEDSISFNGNIPVFDPVKAYGDISKIKKNRRREILNNTLREADELKKKADLPSAVKKLRKALYMAREWDMDPGIPYGKIITIRDEMLRKGNELVKKGRYRQAVPYADTAVLCDPTNKNALRLAGTIFSQTGEEGLGIPYLAAALEKDPDNYKLQHELKTLYLLEGRPDMAIPLINPHSAAYGRIKTHYEEFAQVYLVIYIKSPEERKELTPKIRSSLEKAIKERTDYPLEMNELKMNLALFDERHKDALKYCRVMNKLKIAYPMRTRIIYNMALLNYLVGDEKQAVNYFNETIARVEKKGNNNSAEGRTQGENYMAQMSAWFMDLMGIRPFTPGDAGRIYDRVKNPDHSYRQEIGFIEEFLSAREKKDYNLAAAALDKYTKKRHLQPVGDFAQDLLQVPAQKSLIYISKGKMHQKSGEKEKAEECFRMVRHSKFLGDRAK